MLLRSWVSVGVIFVFLLTNIAHANPFTQRLCKDKENYVCYSVRKHDSWKKVFPDEGQRQLVMKINRTNLPLYRGMRVAIPNDLHLRTQLEYAPFPQQIEPPGVKTVYVSLNPKVLAWGAYDDAGNLINWGPVSGGKGYCPDVGRRCGTVTGKFFIYQKGSVHCQSSKFPIPRGGAPMPYCMFFKGGFALHGSYEVPGYNASHGCVRMLIPDAKWMNEEFVGGDRVRVIVSSVEL